MEGPSEDQVIRNIGIDDIYAKYYITSCCLGKSKEVVTI